MTNHTQWPLVLSYGLFLMWLLSFLYNGPLLELVFPSNNNERLIVVLLYIFVPAVVGLIVSPFQLPKNLYMKMMHMGIIVSGLGSVLLVLVQPLPPLVSYLVASVMGICSVLFIVGWGVAFVYLLKLHAMARTMGLTIALGYAGLSLSQILRYFDLATIGFVFVLVGLGVAYVMVSKLELDFPKETEKPALTYHPKLVWILALTMFFLNVGGGVSQGIMNTDAMLNANIVLSFEMILYLGIFVVILYWNDLLMERDQIVIALTMLGAGFMIFIIVDELFPLSYMMITLAYLLIDITLWTITAQTGRILGRPIKVLLIVMSANLLSVLLGNLLGISIVNNPSYVYLPGLVSAICVMLSFTFVLMLLKEFKIYLHRYQDISEVDLLDLFTKKEVEIIYAMVEGLKNTEIARRLFISQNTLKTHAKSIYAKAEVINKQELIKKFETGQFV